jgi:peptide deformylase
MSIKIILEGNPILKRKSLPVKVFDKKLRILAKEMIDYGKSVDNCVGLAAVQVGELIRMSVIYVDDNWEVMVNPKLLFQDIKNSYEWEGCMSLEDGNLFGRVKRPHKVIVEYFNEYNKRRSYQFEGFYAHLILHEIDHMNGSMFLDLMKKPYKLVSNDDLEKIYKEKDPE